MSEYPGRLTPQPTLTLHCSPVLHPSSIPLAPWPKRNWGKEPLIFGVAATRHYDEISVLRGAERGGKRMGWHVENKKEGFGSRQGGFVVSCEGPVLGYQQHLYQLVLLSSFASTNGLCSSF
jgi:hypothetical protein